jgi:hypothetical protein
VGSGSFFHIRLSFPYCLLFVVCISLFFDLHLGFSGFGCGRHAAVSPFTPLVRLFGVKTIRLFSFWQFVVLFCRPSASIGVHKE